MANSQSKLYHACMCTQSCPTLWDPMHYSPGEGNVNPLQYSCLENPMNRGAWWAAVHRVALTQTQLKRLSSSSSGRTTAHQASLSMEFSRQEYWNGLSFPTPGDLPWSRDQTHISCVSYIGRWFLTTESPGKPILYHITTQILYLSVMNSLITKALRSQDSQSVLRRQRQKIHLMISSC